MRIVIPLPGVKRKTLLFILAFIGILLGLYIFSNFQNKELITRTYATYAKDFEYLSKNGNSSCSSEFKDSINQMPDNARLRGSCCSPMDLHRYTEQRNGLKKYKNIAEIPPDPYNIEASLVKKMMGHYEDTLTPEEQKAYDFAMQNSKEKGPCCCKCWRWYVYGGLAKYLIQNYGFGGEQVTEVWNLSDGCGGAGDHVNHAD